MPLNAPVLDDRSFQEIVDELKKQIPSYCPEWTDHNVSDPGITLLELFAHEQEKMLYRMNQIPMLHYMKFAQFLGIPIPTPQPAHADVAFLLNKPLRIEDFPDNTGLLIKEGTEVSTTQTETTAPLIFATEADTAIYAPVLQTVIQQPRGQDPGIFAGDTLARLRKGDISEKLFSETPLQHDAVYFEFENDVSNHILCLHLEFEAKQATNINVNNPPVVWEAYSENHQWVPMPMRDDADQTKGFNESGSVELQLPKLLKHSWRYEGIDKIKGERYSIRVRVDRTEYDASPVLKGISDVSTRGRVVPTVHLQKQKDELLGISDGSPGQRFPLAHHSVVLKKHEHEEPKLDGTIEVTEPNSTAEVWTYVDHFEFPTERTEHEPANERKEFTIDILSNEVRFAPSFRMSSGEMISYGAVPPRGAEIKITEYRYSGSETNLSANVQISSKDLPIVARGGLNVLKSSIPYIKRVKNQQPAVGGRDAPSVEEMAITVQRFLRLHHGSGTKAVTTDDHELYVLENFPEYVEKAQCRRDRAHPNKVIVFVSPPMTFSKLLTKGLEQAHLAVPEPEIEKIERTLHERRMLTTRVEVRNPIYVPIDVMVDIANSGDKSLAHQVEQALALYLNPHHGSKEGHGWSIGATVIGTDMKTWLERQLDGLKVSKITVRCGELKGDARKRDEKWQQSVELVWHEQVIPGELKVEVA